MNDCARLNHAIATVKDQVARVIVGQEQAVDGVLACLLAGGHALLEGVPGVGKTALVRTLARALDLSFSRIQFTPDLMPADVIGTTVMEESESGQRVFRFARGPIFANVVLADEINRATPKTQSALLEAMQEGTVTVGGNTHRLPEPFCVLATQNPLEMEGTYPLPEAQLDRFLLKLLVPHPTLAELTEIVTRTTARSEADVEPVLAGPELQDLRQVLRDVPVAPPVLDHALRLVLATHPEAAGAPEVTLRDVRVGASPRAGQALVHAARYRAVVEGREAVSFDDVRAQAPAVLRHRLLLSFDGEAAGRTPDDIIGDILRLVPELPADLEHESSRPIA